MTIKKVCSQCLVAKPLDEFHRSPTKSHGRVHHCKPCAKAERATLRQRNLALFRERERIRYHLRKAQA